MRIGYEVCQLLDDGTLTIDEFMWMAEQGWIPLERAILNDCARDAVARGFHPDDVATVIEAKRRELEASRPQRFASIRKSLEDHAVRKRMH